MYGWIAGTTWDTLPMSVEARFIRAATPAVGEGPAQRLGVAPVRRAARRRRRGTRRTACSRGRSRASQPVARAPASKQRQHPLPRSRRARPRLSARTYQRPSVRSGIAFGASPPWVTMPWTRTVGGQLLAQQADRHLGDGEGVGGVDALLRVRRGVGGLALVGDVGVRDRERLGPRPRRPAPGAPSSPGPRRRRRRVPAARSCRRRPPRRGCRRPRPSGRRRRPAAARRERGADRDGGDQVVPAGVAEARQRVVLGAQPDPERARCRRWRGTRCRDRGSRA